MFTEVQNQLTLREDELFDTKNLLLQEKKKNHELQNKVDELKEIKRINKEIRIGSMSSSS